MEAAQLRVGHNNRLLGLAVDFLLIPFFHKLLNLICVGHILPSPPNVYIMHLRIHSFPNTYFIQLFGWDDKSTVLNMKWLHILNTMSYNRRSPREGKNNTPMFKERMKKKKKNDSKLLITR